MRKPKWLQATTIATVLAITLSPGGCDLGTATVTGREVTPASVVSIDNIDVLYPEIRSIELEQGIWVDVTPEVYETCQIGTEFPGCGDEEWGS